MKDIYKTFDIGRFRFGFQRDLVHVKGDPYLQRWILWLGITIRIHKFYRGDQDRALHDHPWWFITFPFHSYREDYWDSRTQTKDNRLVKRFRFHFRPSDHRHIVRKISKGPTWTFVITGWKTREWGFWPGRYCNRFVHWRDWI